MIHHFDPEIAALLGINQAIVLYNLSYLQTQRALQGGDEYFLRADGGCGTAMNHWLSGINTCQFSRLDE